MRKRPQPIISLLVEFFIQWRLILSANDIRIALDAKDFERAHSLAHNLKGLAEDVEFDGIQNLADSLDAY